MNAFAAPRRHSGFTLIELMVVVAILAILATLAAPSFITSIANNRVSSASSEIQTMVQFARSEAIFKRSEVTLTSSGQKWSVKMGEQVLREAELPAQVTVTAGANSGSGVSFDSLGTAKLISGSEPPYALTLTANNASRLQCLAVVRSGVVRQERMAAGSTCNLS